MAQIDYETIYIAHPDLTESKIGEINNRLTEIIKKHGGTVAQSDLWGIRNLAYKIQRSEKGHYLYFKYSAQPAVVEEVKRMLELREDVLKQMTVKLGVQK